MVDQHRTCLHHVTTLPTDPPRKSRHGAVNLIVADLQRSLEFYEQLGMAFVERNRHGGGGPAEAWVSTNPGVTLVLHSTGFASRAGATIVKGPVPPPD